MAARRLVLLTMGWLAIAVFPVAAQEAPSAETIIAALARLEAPSDIEVPALRQQAADRVKAKTDPIALKRPPISRELTKLPHIDLDIQFSPDTPVIRPASYRTIARLADALTNPALMSYVFLVVGHMDANGRRDNNLLLSQRRAEAIRDALVTTFKVSAKRVHAVGLGEEQLLDANNPKAAANQQTQIVTLREVEPVTPSGSAKPPDTHAKKSSRKGSK
ncbi:OmpA family protein [Bradyrhizobium erythrophlei]|jgi:OOP family OmpA-OmpF porin|uniref:Outer membrane protein OmpA n=1 Tax=Bradyrhizobium erythrophlei TaxID=1437360 RepID=A0A1M7UC68_9BRAD|nr:OmpA family protein [Bradyrhizobium erythrophlei]SHN80410.1 Outer membrane protein OmpA [Bradyrhizobium erythrophlei]